MTNPQQPPAPPFELLDIADAAQRLAALDRRRIPESLRSHEAAAVHYVPDQELKDAIHVALAVGAPLLLTGEPGTGKTQVAYYIADQFGLLEDRLFPLFVRSTHTAEDLLYSFDAVGYLHAANDPARRGATVTKGEFVTEGPLWQAYQADGPAVVLIDEIDKAPGTSPTTCSTSSTSTSSTVRSGESGSAAASARHRWWSSPATASAACRSPSCAAAYSTTLS